MCQHSNVYLCAETSLTRRQSNEKWSVGTWASHTLLLVPTTVSLIPPGLVVIPTTGNHIMIPNNILYNLIVVMAQ